jgi:hypothetical protein
VLVAVMVGVAPTFYLPSANFVTKFAGPTYKGTLMSLMVRLRKAPYYMVSHIDESYNLPYNPQHNKRILDGEEDKAPGLQPRAGRHRHLDSKQQQWQQDSHVNPYGMAVNDSQRQRRMAVSPTATDGAPRPRESTTGVQHPPCSTQI